MTQRDVLALGMEMRQLLAAMQMLTCRLGTLLLAPSAKS